MRRKLFFSFLLIASLFCFLFVITSCKSSNKKSEKERTFEEIFNKISDAVDNKQNNQTRISTFYNIYTNNHCPDYSGSTTAIDYKVKIYVAYFDTYFMVYIDYEKSYFNNVIKLTNHNYGAKYKFICDSFICREGLPTNLSDNCFYNSCYVPFDFSLDKGLYFEKGKVEDISGIGNPPYENVSQLTTECEILVDLALKKFSAFLYPIKLSKLGYENY